MSSHFLGREGGHEVTFAWGTPEKCPRRARGMPQLVGARRGDSSLLPKNSKTQRERGGGVGEGYKELERSDSESYTQAVGKSN